ncbi:MAG: FHA domain-containing protein [Anaerolineales bacterium]|nr:FHA domain-containing protein [Anaerolineales bacterium]
MINEKFGNAYLVISTQVYPIEKPSITIGRRTDNDVVINNELISRVHARLEYEEDQFVLFDLDSTGGTYVNNKRVNKSIIYSGDVIILANTPLIFINDRGSMLNQSKRSTTNLEEA